MEKKRQEKVIAKNRRAFHEYEMVETYEAGIELTGTEVRSLRENNCQIKDSFAMVRGGEALVAPSGDFEMSDDELTPDILKHIEDDEYSKMCYGILYKYKEYYYNDNDVLSARELVLFFQDFERRIEQ